MEKAGIVVGKWLWLFVEQVHPVEQVELVEHVDHVVTLIVSSL